jgi:N-acetylgalactosamine kinase
MKGPIYSIILAAGKGSRMGSLSLPKVCLEIAGQPAILRALETYDACGIRPHVVVVGSQAADVMRTIDGAEYPVLYAHQAQLRGTGHAAKQGARILKAAGHEGPVLVVAGDKVIERPVIEKLLRTFVDTDCDMALLATSWRGTPGLGRLVTDQDGTVLACVEQRDVRQRRALANVRDLALGGAHGGDLRAPVLTLLTDEITDPRQASIAFGRLWVRLHEEAPLSDVELLALVPERAGRFEFSRPDGQAVCLSVSEVDETQWANLSVYLFKAPALYFGLDQLTTDNAQGEEYLTDVIRHLLLAIHCQGRRFRVQMVPIDSPKQVMAFNTSAELAEIETYYRTQEQMLT